MSEAATAMQESIRPISRRARWFYAFCRGLTVGSSYVLFPGEVIGRNHLPKTGPYVLAPVHRSNLDWLIVARITRRRLRYIVKEEVWKIPGLGRLLILLGAFPVRRQSADREAFHRCLEVLMAGEPLVLFPEGTRGSGPLVGEMREGAAYLALRAQVPVLPVGVAGTESAMPRGKRLPRPCRVAIVIGAPIEPGQQGASARVSRSATHQMNEQISQAVQTAFSDSLAVLAGHKRAKAVTFADSVTSDVNSEVSEEPAHKERNL